MVFNVKTRLRNVGIYICNAYTNWKIVNYPAPSYMVMVYKKGWNKRVIGVLKSNIVHLWIHNTWLLVSQIKQELPYSSLNNYVMLQKVCIFLFTLSVRLVYIRISIEILAKLSRVFHILLLSIICSPLCGYLCQLIILLHF